MFDCYRDRIGCTGDTIRIAPGTYIENVVVGIDLDLIGTGGASVTTVDGGAAGSVVMIPAAVTVMIDGLTLTNGTAAEGGGINVDGDLTLTNSTVTGNFASGYNGGGGIGCYFGGGSIAIMNSTISNNTAPAGMGGGIYHEAGTLMISGSTISGNTAGEFGGGVYARAATVTLTDSTISGNTSTYSFGGGFELSNSTATISNSTFSGNTAATGGGGFEGVESAFDLINCTFSGNTANFYGGGINVYGTPLGAMTLSNVTITDCTSPTIFGAGLSNRTAASVMLRNTLIAGNFGNYAYPDEVDVYGPVTSLGYNLIGTGAVGLVDGVNGDRVGTGAIPLAALLGPLADNGGPTETHDLMMGSPALDAGDPVTFEAMDQRGVTRPQGLGPDIGSVESGGDFGALCTGDGGDQLGCSNCPCSNNATPGSVGGCVNSAGTGSTLIVAGSPSVSLPAAATNDLRFSATNGPPFQLFI